MGVPQNGWFTMVKPYSMDDLGVPLFLETPIYTYILLVKFYGKMYICKHTIQKS